MRLFKRKGKVIPLGHPVVGDPSKQIKADRRKMYREGGLGFLILAFSLCGVWYIGTIVYELCR